MSSFGAPIQEETVAAAADASAAATEQQEIIDPNDPRLTSESLEENVAADAYAVPPPPPDGKWRAKLKAVPIKDAQGTEVAVRTAVNANMNNGKPYFATNVAVHLHDLSGKFDDVVITEYWVKSVLDKRKNVSQTTTITVKAGGQAASSPSTERSRMDALMKTLATEPEVIVETVWKATCQKCEQAAEDKGQRKPGPVLIGMQRFPAARDAQGKLLPGEHDPMVKCGTCNSMVRAQARIAGFFSVNEAKATRGTA